MAKEDFCFTYYDGDAARDMAHLNRLERGAYSDLIVSQRKFGHLPISIIKKTLGNDFDVVWESIEIILKKDDDGKFYIEWLENSVSKMKKQSTHQSLNGSKGGRPKKPNETQIEENKKPNETQTYNKKKPLENGYGYGYEDVNVLENFKGVAGENFKPDERLIFPNQNEMDAELPSHEMQNCKMLVSSLTVPRVYPIDNDIVNLWQQFKLIKFNGQNEYYGWNKVYENFKYSIRLQITNKKIFQDVTKPVNQTAAERANDATNDRIAKARANVERIITNTAKNYNHQV